MLSWLAGPSVRLRKASINQLERETGFEPCLRQAGRDPLIALGSVLSTSPVPSRSSRTFPACGPPIATHISRSRSTQKALGSAWSGSARCCVLSGGAPSHRSYRCTMLHPSGSARRTQTSWSGRRDSNPRPSAWKAETLPLSYSRLESSLSPSPSCSAAQAHGGRGRIRTSVAHKGRQIYSLLPLATRPPVRPNREPPCSCSCE